jgi:hypothetical protein
MVEDYSERLLTHFVAGQWRAPFGERCMSVTVPEGKGTGQIVSAGPRDIARALSVMRGGDAVAQQRFGNAIELALPALTKLFNQHGDLDIKDLQRFQRFSPRIVLGSACTPLNVLVAALQIGVERGVIFCPAPEQAALAVALATLVQNADLPPGAFALLHARTPKTETALRKTGLPVLEV